MIDRVLIVGHGSIGKRHLRIARELLSEADIRVMRHQPCSEVPQFSNGCLDDIEAVAAFAPQIAVIANPAPFHLNVAIALAKLGCDLLIEKPLSHNSEGIEPLLELEQAHRLVIQIGYNLRFHNALIRFRELIQEGLIGRVLSVRSEVGQYLPSWRLDTDYRSGVSARSELGGGVLLELSHELDYLRWIFGEPSVVSAWLRKLSDLEVDVEDSVHLNLELASVGAAPGVIATVDIDFIRHDTARTCAAIGDRGSLRWNGVTGEIDCWKEGAKEWESLFQYQHERDDTYRSEWEHFLGCVQNREKPLIALEDGFAVMRLIDATRASDAAAGVNTVVSEK